MCGGKHCSLHSWLRIKKASLQVQKQKSSHAGEFVECLQCLVMTDTEDIMESHDQPDLSDTWLEKVDRGGLYKITGMGYRLFREIELASYSLLAQNFSHKSKTTTDDISQVVLKDSDVQFLWAIIAVDVSVENEKDLLLAIVQQWVLIRGHSLRHKHMEQHKKTTKGKSTKKQQKGKKALRKEHKCPTQQASSHS